MKETCSQSDWRPACPEGHSSPYLVEFVSKCGMVFEFLNLKQDVQLHHFLFSK